MTRPTFSVGDQIRRYQYCLDHELCVACGKAPQEDPFRKMCDACVKKEEEENP